MARRPSRVFFDKLGPPWPKHTCTDNSPPKFFRGPTSPPVRRPRGLMLELLEAARTESEGTAPGDGATIEDTWILAEVVSLSRAGWQNAVLAESIGAPDRRRASFDFDSANDVMKPGDIFSLSDREISVVDLSAMKQKRYKTQNLQHPIQDG